MKLEVMSVEYLEKYLVLKWEHLKVGMMEKRRVDWWAGLKVTW